MSARTIKTSITVLISTVTLAFTYSAVAQEDTTTKAADTTKSESDKTPSKSESYLKDIRDTLVLNINKLPVYLNQLTKMSLSWLAPDDSSATATLQNRFTSLANTKLQNARTQTESQDLFLGTLIKPETSPIDSTNIAYQTLLSPLTPKNSAMRDNAIYKYTVYASGLNIQHAPPQYTWERSPAVDIYRNYFYTTSAVQTYNGYILSDLYANSKNGNKVKEMQDSLTQQASSSDWFTQIASENIGVVLRQILLYNSQTYVVMTQLLDTQQKLLVAQTMNNALLIAVNQEAENRLYSKASGERPI